jgi:hypothetical protein
VLRSLCVSNLRGLVPCRKNEANETTLFGPLRVCHELLQHSDQGYGEGSRGITDLRGLRPERLALVYIKQNLLESSKFPNPHPPPHRIPALSAPGAAARRLRSGRQRSGSARRAPAWAGSEAKVRARGRLSLQNSPNPPPPRNNVQLSFFFAR